MSDEIRATVRSGAPAGSERRTVLLLAGLIVLGLVAYIGINALGGGSGDSSTRNMLPYQVLVQTLPETDQAAFRSVRGALQELEARRARDGRWPEIDALQRDGVAPFQGSDTVPRWQRFQEKMTVDYLGVPVEPAAPAWLLSIAEPEPGMLPDPAPNDDEHHRLPDGTTLHIYVWMHRFGSQIAQRFTPMPQNDNWIQVFNQPPNPMVPFGRR